MNCRGIANDKKRRCIFDFHRCNADLLILCETHSKPELENIWQNEWGGKIIYNHGSANARGIMVCIKKNAPFVISNVYKNTDGRLILFDLEQNGQNLSLAIVYAPNEDCPQFFTDMAELMRNRSENKVIVGDFNLTLNVDVDRMNTYHNNNKAKQEILNIMEEFQLRDIWRDRNTDKFEFSWFKKTTRAEERKASRIDFALISGGMDQKTELVQYISSIMTDHRAIYMVIEMVTDQRGSGYWKLNTALLQDYLTYIKKEILFTLQANCHKTPSVRWEQLKKRIKKSTIAYSRGKVSQDKLIISHLSEKVNEYEERLPLEQHEDQLYENTKNELQEKLMSRIAGVMFRSKAKWYELGEKTNKYFFALEKAKYNAKTCFRLITDNHQELSEQQQIIEAQRLFYTQLYSADKDVEFTWTNQSDIMVPLDVKQLQEELITQADLEKAIKGMNNCKTPGRGWYSSRLL